jgi:hypothetical protein
VALIQPSRRIPQRRSPLRILNERIGVAMRPVDPSKSKQTLRELLRQASEEHDTQKLDELMQRILARIQRGDPLDSPRGD